jgi:uncharacterized membrane protein YagU involved in acid resistance
VNFVEWAVWGFVATVVLTTLMAGSQGVGLTRMNLPYLLGTLVTHDRERAKVFGIAIHMVNGWLLALLYLAIFHVWGGGVLRGVVVGAAHALFVLMVMMPAFPGLHPRMAGQHRGPTTSRQLEPPGFLALHYGYQTPLSVLLAHLVYGGILGAFYHLGA